MGFIEDIRDFINSFSASEPKMAEKKKARWAFEEDKKSSEMTKMSKPEPKRETRKDARESRESNRKRR